MKKEVVSVYVDNKANVLSRVVSLYGRRGSGPLRTAVRKICNPYNYAGFHIISHGNGGGA